MFTLVWLWLVLMVLYHRTQVAEAICNFWQDIWQEPAAAAPQSSEQLLPDFLRSGPDPRNFQWTPLAFDDLWASVRGASGSGGADQWSGSEIKHLPREAVEVLFELTRFWESTQRLPAQLREARQVSLPKTAKVINNQLPISQVRPISVMSIFWRTYASAWAKSDQVRNWADSHLDRAVCFGKGARGAELRSKKIFCKVAMLPV